MNLKNLWGLILLITLLCFTNLVPFAHSTDDDHRTVILISIDGMRADYLTPEHTPHLFEFAQMGVRAKYLEPVFPSKTFPNHYSIITGLYPANHGIISNSIYDPDVGLFRLSDREMISKSSWWGGEPLWVTVQKHGRMSATYFWPGSEADSIQGMQPNFWMVYDDDLPHPARIDSVMTAVHRTPRPGLITTYFSIVDTYGHRYGPDSDETREALRDVDSHIGDLIDRLRQSGLLDEINLVILGDHGMAATSNERVEMVDEYINMDDVYVVGGLDALGFFNLKDSTQLDSLVHELNRMQHVDWYASVDLPKEYRYSGNDLIPDITGIAEVGWLMATTDRFNRNPAYYSGGTHGYDPSHPTMHSAFIAHGPQFKKNQEVDGFSLVHVYELLCAVLGIEPAQNDGDLSVVKHLLSENP